MSFEIKQIFQRHGSPLWKYYSSVTLPREVSLQSGARIELQPAGPCLWGLWDTKHCELNFVISSQRQNKGSKSRQDILLQNFWRDKIDPICHHSMYDSLNGILLGKFLWPLISIHYLYLLQQIMLFSNF